MKKWIACLICMAGIFSAARTHAQNYSLKQLDTTKVFFSIENGLQDPEQVIRLDLTRERLKDFPAEILQFTNLQELVLNKNKLDSIPKSITQLKHLTILRANRNKIDSFPAYLCKLNKLVMLDLSNNYIKSIPDEIYKLKNLEELIMWSNIINHFPQSLSRLKKLKTFDLLHNEMSVSEQDKLKFLLPDVELILSPPCNCEFD